MVLAGTAMVEIAQNTVRAGVTRCISAKNSLNGKQAPQNTNYYAQLQSKYNEYLRSDEFLTITEALDAVNSKTISLLTTDVRTRRLIFVSRETMEEDQKNLKIEAELLSRR